MGQNLDQFVDKSRLSENIRPLAPVAQWIEQLVSTQSVGGSSPSGRAFRSLQLRHFAKFAAPNAHIPKGWP